MYASKEEVKKLLTELPDVKEFFGNCLEKRLEKDDWCENPILMVLARDKNLDPLLGQIKIAKEMLSNYNDFCPRELKGDEADFDEKVLDKHAELRTLGVLYDKSYKGGCYIPRVEGQKTPDFKLERKDGQIVLVEVRHKRDPSLPDTLKAFSGGPAILRTSGTNKVEILDTLKKILARSLEEKKMQFNDYDKSHQYCHIISIVVSLLPGIAFLLRYEPYGKEMDELVNKLGGEILYGNNSIICIFEV